MRENKIMKNSKENAKAVQPVKLRAPFARCKKGRNRSSNLSFETKMQIKKEKENNWNFPEEINIFK